MYRYTLFIELVCFKSTYLNYMFCFSFNKKCDDCVEFKKLSVSQTIVQNKSWSQNVKQGIVSRKQFLTFLAHFEL